MRERMKKTLITREQFKVMPWKNGAGVTAEIDIQPKGSDFSKEDFEWRLSSARIEEENDFSEFSGYSRVLTVLSGEGLSLNGQELGPFEVFEFQGEDAIVCEPLAGPVEDLGVIFKRAKYRCTMQLVNATDPMELELEAGTHFLLSLSANEVSIDGTLLLRPEFMKIEGAGKVKITAVEYPAALLRVFISDGALVQ